MDMIWVYFQAVFHQPRHKCVEYLQCMFHSCNTSTNTTCVFITGTHSKYDIKHIEPHDYFVLWGAWTKVKENGLARENGQAWDMGWKIN